MDDYYSVTCELCGMDFLIIHPLHLRFNHDMTTEEYIAMFPGAPLICEELVERLRESHQEWWDSKQGLERREKLQGNSYFGRE